MQSAHVLDADSLVLFDGCYRGDSAPLATVTADESPAVETDLPPLGQPAAPTPCCTLPDGKVLSMMTDERRLALAQRLRERAQMQPGLTAEERAEARRRAARLEKVTKDRQDPPPAR